MTGPKAGPSFRFSLAVMVVGGLLGAVAIVNVIPTFVRTVRSPTSLVAPGATTVELKAGSYQVFERTGTSRGTGNVAITNSGGITLSPEQVVVVGPEGSRLPTASANGSETITLGSGIYTGAVAFRVRTSGDHEVRIEADARGDLFVSRSLGDTFGSMTPWFTVGFSGAVVGCAGFVMANVGAARRRGATPATAGWTSSSG